MYNVRVIKGNKNALVNYINALHVFSKNLVGHYLIFFVQNYIVLPKLQARWRIFEKLRGPCPPPSTLVETVKFF